MLGKEKYDSHISDKYCKQRTNQISNISKKIVYLEQTATGGLCAVREYVSRTDSYWRAACSSGVYI